MHGPLGPGHWTGDSALASSHEFLKAGRRYRVLRAFVDFDGDPHPRDEEWVFLGQSFLPHDDGLSLFVSLDGSREWQIRLQWRPDAQGAILDRLTDYIAPV